MALLHFLRTLVALLKLVVYTFMGYISSGINVLCAWLDLSLLVIYVIACCSKLEM